VSATVVLDRAIVTLPAKVPCSASASTPAGGPVSLRHAHMRGRKDTKPEHLCGSILSSLGSSVQNVCMLPI